MDKPKKGKPKSKGDTWTEKELAGTVKVASSSKTQVTKATKEEKGATSTDAKPKKSKIEEKRRPEPKDSPKTSKRREVPSEGKVRAKDSTTDTPRRDKPADTPKREKPTVTAKKKQHSRTEPVPPEYSASHGSPSKRVSSKRSVASTHTTKDRLETPELERKSKDKGKDAKRGKGKREDRDKDKKDKDSKAEKKKPEEGESERKHRKEKKGDAKSNKEEKRGNEEAAEEPKSKGKEGKERKSSKSKHEDTSKEEHEVKAEHKQSKQPALVTVGQPPVQEQSDSIEEDYEYEEDFDDYDEEMDSSDHTRSPTVSIPSSPYKNKLILNSPSFKKQPYRGSHDESQISDVLQALTQENKQVLESRENSAYVAQDLNNDYDDDDDDDYESGKSSSEEDVKERTKKKSVAVKTKTSAFRRVMDFASAQKKAANVQVSKKAKKRGQELLALIELDIVEFTLFDLPPLSEYELYVKKFGSDTSRQMAVQTGEDNLDQDIQTDPIVSSNVWVQWPPTDFRGYGREDGEDASAKRSGRVAQEDSIKLAAFLKKAGQVCSIILEENLALQNKTESQTKSTFSFCTDQFLFQNIPSILNGWCMTNAHFSVCKDHLLVASYANVAGQGGTDGHVFMGVVAVWNSRALFGPNMVLLCHSPTTCCCLSPLKSTLAFAGCQDGSVVLWDLREPASLHVPLNPDDQFLGRFPTFSTAGIPQLSSHHSPVLWIGVLSIGDGSSPTNSSHSSEKLTHAAITDPDLGGEDGDTTSIGLSFQLATLDTSGILKLWVVVELAAADPYGSDSDLGLIPGGRVKLVKSVTMDLSSLPGQSAVPCEVYSLRFHPRDTNHIYVGTGAGFVTHHTRYGQRAIPSTYSPGDASLGTSLDLVARATACAVTNISFCSQQPDHFLVGCSDGSIRLHHTKRASPSHVIPSSTDGVGIKTIQWVEHCPGLVLVVDHVSKLYMWDLVDNDAQPVFTKQLPSSVSCCRLSLPVQNSVYLLLAYENGTVELHSMKPLPQELGERQKLLSNYLTGLL